LAPPPPTQRRPLAGLPTYAIAVLAAGSSMVVLLLVVLIVVVSVVVFRWHAANKVRLVGAAASSYPSRGRSPGGMATPTLSALLLLSGLRRKG
jgi:hypothetical protein